VISLLVAFLPAAVAGLLLHDTIKEILFEIDRLRNEPPTEAELRGIQNYLAGTFVLRDGKIAYKLNGPVTEANLERVLKPEIEKALAAR